MKAEVEGEVRVKCYMPSCSGESTQLDPPFINITLIYPLYTLYDFEFFFKLILKRNITGYHQTFSNNVKVK